MANNNNLNLVGTVVETDIRKITTDERANGGQTVTANNGIYLISDGGQLGAKSQSGAVLDSINSIFIIRSNSNRGRNGAINYGDSSGVNQNGKVNIRNASIRNNRVGSTDQFFTQLIDSQYITTGTGDQLIRFQNNGQFTGNYCDFVGSGAVELHGNVQIANNQFNNLRGGFINFSSGQNLNIEGQNFGGALDRLGMISAQGGTFGELTFIDCQRNGVDLNQVQIQGFQYIVYLPGSGQAGRHIYFAKRQQFNITDSNDNVLSATVEYKGNSITNQTYTASSVNHLQPLFRSNEVTHRSFNFNGLQITNWVYNISNSNPITRKIYKYGYNTQSQTYNSYDNYVKLSSGSVLKLATNENITETNKSTVDGYTELETPAKFYDRFESYRNESANIDNITTISKVGDNIDLGSYSLVVDATASQVFSISGNTITIKASTYSGGLESTGTITTANGANIVGGIIDSVGNAFLSFSGISSWRVYDTEADRDSNTSQLGNGTVSENFRFIFSTNRTYYLRLVAGGDVIFKNVDVSSTGETEVSLGTASLLTALPSTVDAVVANRLDGVDLPGIVSDAVWNEPTSQHNTAGSFGQFVQGISGGGSSGGASASDIYTYFTSSNRQNTFKADVSGLATSSALTGVNTSLRNEINDNEAKIDLIKVQTDKLNTLTELDGINYRFTTNALEQGGGTSPSDIYSYFTTDSRADAFKADLTSLNDISVADIWSSASRTLTDKAGFGLSQDQVDAIAVKVEQSILDESDGRQVLNAIVGAIGNQNVDEVALVAAIRADLERNNGNLNLIKRQTDKFNDMIETNGPNNKFTSSALENIGGSNPENIYNYFTDNGRADSFKADVSNLSADVNVVQVNGSNVSSVNDFKADVSNLATYSALQTVDTNIDDIKAETEKLKTMVELDGTTYRFTTNALERAPSGSNVNTSDISNIKNNVNAIKNQTDKFTFDGSDVKATLDGEEVTTDSASRNASKADLSSIATSASITSLDTKVSGIKSETDKLNEVIAVNGSDYTFTPLALSAAPVTQPSAVYNYFSPRANTFKADVSGLSNDVNIVSVNGTNVTDIDDFKADISSVATAADIPTASQIANAVLDEDAG